MPTLDDERTPDATRDLDPSVRGGGAPVQRTRAHRADPRRRRLVLLLVGIGVLSFALRVWAPGPVTETTDESIWLKRSDAFRTALADGDLRHATAAGQIPGHANDTMPGITTMWAGTIGRNLADLAGRVGLIDRPSGPSHTEPDVLRLSRAVVALWCSLALMLFTYLATRLVGRAAGLVAGVLLATEPWLVGLSNLLHTDAMVAMFSACSIAALAVALGLGSPRPADRWPAAPPQTRWLLTSGAFAGLATLTKVNAPAIVGSGAAVVVLTALWHADRSRGGAPRPPVVRPIVRLGLVWSLVVVALFVLGSPALWVAPIDHLTDLENAIRQVGLPQAQFFRGHVTQHPGPEFYPVTFAFRATPWTLLGAVAVLTVIVVRAICAIAHRPRLARLVAAVPTWPAIACLPYLALITASGKKLDRYAIPVLPLLALMIGSLVVVLTRAVVDRLGWQRALGPCAAGAAAVAAVLCLVQAPFAISYVDPVLGQQRASRTILLGWGEGVERMGAVIARREAGRCERVHVLGNSLRPIPVPCGTLVSPTMVGFAHADYAITSITQTQRGMDRPMRRALRAQHAAIIDRIRIGGVSYAELWKIPKPVRGASGG